MPYLKILDDHLYIPGSFDTPSYGLALYHQSTYNNLFTEGLSITAGIRLDYEKQKMDYNSEAKMRMGFGFVENGPVIDIEKLFPIPTTVMDASVSQDFWASTSENIFKVRMLAKHVHLCIGSERL